MTIRKSSDRGLANHGWLKSRHTFSFAEYYDPQHMGFGPLRVINEDRIKGGTGFSSHPHHDMEIISYVISGGLRHKDSMGNVTTISPGEVQRMSAGTGIVHSEYNNEMDTESHFFQIWIIPHQRGIKPDYGQKSFEADLRTKKIVHVISPEGTNGSISINQDANMYISRLKKYDDITFEAKLDRKLWIQIIKGKIEIDGIEIETGDAVALSKVSSLLITSKDDSEFILFDLP